MGEEAVRGRNTIIFSCKGSLQAAAEHKKSIVTKSEFHTRILFCTSMFPSSLPHVRCRHPNTTDEKNKGVDGLLYLKGFSVSGPSLDVPSSALS